MNNFLSIRSWLFAPANVPKFLYNTLVFNSDAIIFDLEDSVPLAEKEDARELLVEALKTINYGNTPIFARVNGIKTEFGYDDIKYLVEAGLKNIRLPMCESELDIKELDDYLTKLEDKNNIEKGSVKIAAALETPIAVYNALSIAKASKRVIGISFGIEDFTRSLGINRSKEETELLYARSKIVLEANIAGVASVDGVYTNIDDTDGFYKQCEFSRSLGFTGKACIHPSQISILHKAYTPKEEEIIYSLKVIEATKNIEGGGVISLEGKMIDIPVIEKAKKIIELAKKAKLLI